MKKILVCMMVLAMVFSTAALAAERADVESAAQAVVGADARLVEYEMDDGYYELEYASDTARYDVTLDRDGVVIEMDADFRDVRRSSETVLDEAAATDAALAFLGSGTAQYALLERDDGRYEWNVFFTDGSDVGVVSVQTETGEILSVERYYGLASQILSADAAVDALNAAQGPLEVVELDIDLDDGRAPRYDGKALVDGRAYEFEMNAATGDIYEWERD